MSKLTRKLQTIFGNTGPTGIVGQFGSFRTGSPAYSLDPDVIQALNAFKCGFAYAGSTSNGVSFQDFNGLVYLLSRQIKYLHQSGIPNWLSTITYSASEDGIAGIVTDRLGGIYSSRLSNNLNNALTDFTSRLLLCSTKVTIPTTNTYTAINSDYIIDFRNQYGSSHAAATCILPLKSTCGIGRVFNILQTNSDIDHVTIKIGGVDLCDIPYKTSIKIIYGNYGVNILSR